MSRLHIRLTDRAAAGLHAAMELTGDDEQTVTQHALVAYAELVRLGQHQGDYRAVLHIAGLPLYMTAGRTERTKRWWQR